MRHVLLVFWFWLFLSGPLAGQVAPIRAGEHGNFTRVVIPIEKNVEWNLARKNKNVTISFAPRKFDFDLSQVFSRISKNRVERVHQEEGESSLTLEISCDCNIDSFRANSNLIAIDIIDRDSRVNTSKPRLPVISSPVLAYRSPTIEKLSKDGRKNEGIRTLPNEFPAGSISPNFSTSNTRRFVVTQISRAADQGILRGIDTSDEVTEKTNLQGEPLTSFRETPQLSAITAVDEALKELKSSKPAGSENACISDAFLAIDSWGNEKTSFSQLSRLRSDMFGEFDKANAEVMISLAKLQLYFGFGKEAERTLELLPTGSLQKSTLQSIARTLDAPLDVKASAVENRQHCDGFSSMWSLLSDNGLAKNANTDAILRSHAKLPPHLKAHLGARLSRLLAEGGETSAARSIISQVERSTSKFTPSIELSKVVVLEELSQYGAAARQSEKITVGNYSETPEALVKQVDSTVREIGGEIHDKTPSLIAAYSKELEGSPLEIDLKMAEIKALALTGEFSRSAKLIADLEGLVSETEFSNFLHQTTPLFTIKADDISFLNYILTYTAQVSSSPNEDDRVLSASRILELGFPQAAMTVLVLQPNQEPTTTFRLLRAKAFLASDDPNRALFELMGMRGVEVDDLRTSALWKSKNYSEAAALSENLKNDALAAKAYNRAGEIQNSPIAQGLLEQVSRDLKTTPASPNQEKTPLFNARLLLENSRSTRERVNSLLDAAELRH